MALVLEVVKTTRTHFVVSPLPILTKWTGGVSVFVDIVVTGQYQCDLVK